MDRSRYGKENGSGVFINKRESNENMNTRARVKLRVARRKKAVLRKKKPRVAGEFWKDVAGYKKLFGGTHKDAVKGTRGSVKWVNKRWNRMSKKRRELAEQETGGEGKIKQTIIERAMSRHGIKDMNRAKDWWEARGSK